MKLSNLQHDFQELIFSRKASADLLDDVYPSHRLEAYVDGYPARIAEALEETYTRLKEVLSDDEWSRLVEEFSAEFRSPSRNLSEASNYFVGFFARHSIATERPILLSLANLERTIMEVFHERSEPGLRVEDLARMFSLDPSQVELRPQPFVRVLEHRAGVFDLWRKCASSNARADENEHLLLYRREWEVMIEPVAPTAAVFLRALKDNPRFENACEKLSEIAGADGSPPPLHEWLHGWTQRSLFISQPNKKET